MRALSPELVHVGFIVMCVIRILIYTHIYIDIYVIYN